MSRRRDHLIDKKIGSVIRMQRVKLRMSQGELGKGWGVIFSADKEVENGTNAVTSTRIPDLCRVIELSPNYLFGVSARMNSEVSRLKLLGHEDRASTAGAGAGRQASGRYASRGAA